LRLLRWQRFSQQPPSSVVKQHQSPTVLACKQVPSALVKVYQLFCNLCYTNVAPPHEELRLVGRNLFSSP
jgi:hypothetical protein